MEDETVLVSRTGPGDILIKFDILIPPQPVDIGSKMDCACMSSANLGGLTTGFPVKIEFPQPKASLERWLADNPKLSPSCLGLL